MDTLKTGRSNVPSDNNDTYDFSRDDPQFCNVEKFLNDLLEEQLATFKSLNINKKHDPLAVQQGWSTCIVCNVPLRLHSRYLCGGDLCINQTYKLLTREEKKQMYIHHIAQYLKKNPTIKQDSDEDDDDEVARWLANDTTTRCLSA